MNPTRIIRRQDGMTLFEVLIVVLILGVIAAASYAIFLGQDESALDAEAKSNARSLLWKVHSCFTAREDYTLCDEPTEQEPPPGITWGDGPGEVQVVQGPQTTRYQVTVTALSRAQTDGHNHAFSIVKIPGESETRVCVSDGGSNDAGGCSDGTW